MKAVFFDFDGVLTTDKTGSLTTLRYLSAQTGVEIERFRTAFKQYNPDLNLGRVTHDDIWGDLCADLGVEMDQSLLLGAFESTPMNTEMLALARQLKETYAVGIITDNKKDRIDYLKQHLGLEALFDPIVVSAEVGSDKTGTAIFERAHGHLGVAASDCIFIDNSMDNLLAPSGLGMRTIYFDDEVNDVLALRRLLVQEL
ncbi:MAG: HAD hydrolase-like protein [Burkholderiales bacterium]|nr:HAD hydrolase-like protein [Burkholderiales bacterium]